MPSLSSGSRRLVAAAAVAAVAVTTAASPVLAASQTSSGPSVAASVDGTVTAAATNDALVQSWYQDFLGRLDPSADPGRQYWVNRLDRGERPSDVLWSLTETREYAQVNVQALYETLLERAVDPGAEYWISGVDQRGMALEWVAQNIYASDEFYRDVAGSNPRELVTIWYLSLTGREPFPGEVNYWVDRLQSINRLQVLREFWYAPESVESRVIGNYVVLLGRQPSPGEVRYWSPLERESDRNVGVLIASTPEYASLIG